MASAHRLPALFPKTSSKRIRNSSPHISAGWRGRRSALGLIRARCACWACLVCTIMFSDPSPSGASTSSSWVFAEEDHANITEAARLQSSSISALVERMWGALATNDKDNLDELFGQLADTDAGDLLVGEFGEDSEVSSLGTREVASKMTCRALLRIDFGYD